MWQKGRNSTGVNFFMRRLETAAITWNLHDLDNMERYRYTRWNYAVRRGRFDGDNMSWYESNKRNKQRTETYTYQIYTCWYFCLTVGFGHYCNFVYWIKHEHQIYQCSSVHILKKGNILNFPLPHVAKCSQHGVLRTEASLATSGWKNIKGRLTGGLQNSLFLKDWNSFWKITISFLIA